VVWWAMVLGGAPGAFDAAFGLKGEEPVRRDGGGGRFG